MYRTSREARGEEGAPLAVKAVLRVGDFVGTNTIIVGDCVLGS